MLSKDGFFTIEQDEWLKVNYPQFSNREELTKEFNRVFGTERNISAISDRATKRLHLKRENNYGQYGNRCKEELPIGSIRENEVGTYIKVRSDAGAKTSGYQRPYWIPLQEKIYTDTHGELPKGYMVCFLDNNRHNFSLDNLYPINRRISAVMSSNRWWTDNKVNTLTAIKWCELHYQLKERR